MRKFTSIAGGMAAAALLAACASRPVPAPAPERPLALRPTPPPAVPPAPVGTGAEDWRDRPLTPGDWSYESGEARYGDFSLRCDSGSRRVVLSRAGASGPLRLRTTYGERTLAAGAALPAADPLLDELAFSRGRFAVEAAGTAMLVLPAWPEPARVVEDCRG